MGKKNLDWISNLRAMSTISVVLLHVAALYAGNYTINPNDRSWWIIADIIDGFVRFCVPVFVMISGFLWLSGTETATIFYKKKTLRLIGPFLFWSFICYLFNIFYMKYQSSNVHIFEDFYHQFRSNSLCFHFWYVYMLIGLFLITPVFQVWIKNVNKKEVKTFLIVWICVLIYENTIFDSIRIGIELQMFYGYIGYLVLGYYLGNHIHLSPKKEKNIGKFLFLGGVIITIVGTYIVSTAAKQFYVKFYEYLTINVLIASIGIFMWFKNIEIKNTYVIIARNSISKYGYGIYLCHVMVLNSFTKYWPWANVHPLIYIPSLTILTFFLSWSIIYLLNKIPLGKYFIG
jgi:surface polysaccharide O-acyltransferase-like enzyme